ncbi:MAG TPA: hypothetical protein PLG15_01630 [Candidatus Gastranaerophilaceae bacterium]|nr:hypothetical protein [Candidatus Gastranaerophilaceae bacterium]HPT41065.1 hypothetical protein [Candidatus Gastranaerophilaceae bacterium]
MKILFNAFNNSFYQTNNVQAKKSPQVCASLSKDLFVKNSSHIHFKGERLETDNKSQLLEIVNAEQLLERLNDNGKVEGKDYLSDLEDKASVNAYRHLVILDGGSPCVIYNFDAANSKLVFKEIFKYPVIEDRDEEIENKPVDIIKDYSCAFAYARTNAESMKTIYSKEDGGCSVMFFDFNSKRIPEIQDYDKYGKLKMITRC